MLYCACAGRYATLIDKGEIDYGKKDDRFEVISTESSFADPSRTVLMDTVTGVQYLFVQFGNAGGLCPLVDKDGKPLTWNV